MGLNGSAASTTFVFMSQAQDKRVAFKVDPADLLVADRDPVLRLLSRPVLLRVLLSGWSAMTPQQRERACAGAHALSAD